MKSELLSCRQVAEILGVSDRHVRRLLSEGKLQGEKLGVWQWAIRLTSVDRYIKEKAAQDK